MGQQTYHCVFSLQKKPSILGKSCDTLSFEQLCLDTLGVSFATWDHLLQTTVRFEALEALPTAEELPIHRDIRHLVPMGPGNMSVRIGLMEVNFDWALTWIASELLFDGGCQSSSWKLKYIFTFHMQESTYLITCFLHGFFDNPESSGNWRMWSHNAVGFHQSKSYSTTACVQLRLTLLIVSPRERQDVWVLQPLLSRDYRLQH